MNCLASTKIEGNASKANNSYKGRRDKSGSGGEMKEVVTDSITLCTVVYSSGQEGRGGGGGRGRGGEGHQCRMRSTEQSSVRAVV